MCDAVSSSRQKLSQYHGCVGFLVTSVTPVGGTTDYLSTAADLFACLSKCRSVRGCNAVNFDTTTTAENWSGLYMLART